MYIIKMMFISLMLVVGVYVLLNEDNDKPLTSNVVTYQVEVENSVDQKLTSNKLPNEAKSIANFNLFEAEDNQSLSGAEDLDDSVDEQDIAYQYEKEFSEQEGESDQAWQVFSAHFDNTDFEGLAFQRIECHQYSCRAEWAIEKEQAQDRVLSQLGTPPLDKGGVYYINEDNSRLVIIANHQFSE